MSRRSATLTKKTIVDIEVAIRAIREIGQNFVEQRVGTTWQNGRTLIFSFRETSGGFFLNLATDRGIWMEICSLADVLNPERMDPTLRNLPETADTIIRTQVRLPGYLEDDSQVRDCAFILEQAGFLSRSVGFYADSVIIKVLPREFEPVETTKPKGKKKGKQG